MTPEHYSPLRRQAATALTRGRLARADNTHADRTDQRAQGALFSTDELDQPKH